MFDVEFWGEWEVEVWCLVFCVFFGEVKDVCFECCEFFVVYFLVYGVYVVECFDCWWVELGCGDVLGGVV